MSWPAARVGSPSVLPSRHRGAARRGAYAGIRAQRRVSAADTAHAGGARRGDPGTGSRVGRGVQMGRRARGGLRVRGAAAAGVTQRPGYDPGLPGAGGPGPPGWPRGRGPGRGDRRLHRRPPELRGPAAADARWRAGPAPGGRGPGDLPGLRHHVRRRAAADQRALRTAAGHPGGAAPGRPARARPALVSRRRPRRARGERPRRAGGCRGQAARLALPARPPLPRLAEDQEPAAPGRGRGRRQPRARPTGRTDRLAACRHPLRSRPGSTPAASAPASPSRYCGRWRKYWRRCGGTARHSAAPSPRSRPGT